MKLVRGECLNRLMCHTTGCLVPGRPGLARADYHISPLSSANIFAALAISAVARCGDVVRNSLLINHQLWRAQVLEVALLPGLLLLRCSLFSVLSAGTVCVAAALLACTAL